MGGGVASRLAIVNCQRQVRGNRRPTIKGQRGEEGARGGRVYRKVERKSSGVKLGR